MTLWPGTVFGGRDVRQKRARSVLCLPIVKQTKLIGALYLENCLTPRAFTSDRIACWRCCRASRHFAGERRLYSDLQRSQAYLAEGQSISHTGSFGRNVLSGEMYWSEETYKIYELDRSVKPTMEFVFQRVHPDDRDLLRQTIDRSIDEQEDFSVDYRLLRPDGSVKYLHVLARAMQTSSGDVEFVGTVTRRDRTQAGRAEVPWAFGTGSGCNDVMNGEGRIVLVNAQVEKLFGYSGRSSWGKRLRSGAGTISRSTPPHRKDSSPSPGCGRWGKVSDCTEGGRTEPSFLSRSVLARWRRRREHLSPVPSATLPNVRGLRRRCARRRRIWHILTESRPWES